MLLSDIDDWSVLALHQISTDLGAERITIDSLVDELDTIGQLPGWDSVAADNARNRIGSARTALLDDRVILQTVETLADETARQLTDLKDELADIREIVASHNGRMHLSDSGEVTVTGPGRVIQQLRAIAEELETRARQVIADAEALDSDCAAVLNYLAGPQPLAYGPYLGNDHMVQVTGTEGDDHITVAMNNTTRMLEVTVNGITNTHDPAEIGGVTIDGGSGNDTIDVDPAIIPPYQSTHHPLDALPGVRVNGGTGNDRITGGRGRDYLNGGSGDDIIDGAGGNDVIYGGDGVDTLWGNDGDDYMDGGMGADVLRGGVGNDLLHGGRGDDRLFSNSGDDVVITGEGNDYVRNSNGNDTILAQVANGLNGASEDIVAPIANINGYNNVQDTELVDIRNISVSDHLNPQPEFVQRVWADLELLRSTESGQAMLESLGRSESSTIILPSVDEDSYSMPQGTLFEYEGNDYQLQDQSAIMYNPSMVSAVPTYDNGEVVDHTTWTPVTTLFHEMAHVYDATNGELTPGSYTGSDPIDRRSLTNTPWGVLGLGAVANAERVAVGLPIDVDNDGHEEMATDHPILLTENALRSDLGLERRTTYGSGVPPR